MEYMDLKSLLNFGLPNMPRTVIGLRKKAQRDGWQTRRRQGKGGGVEYALPAEIRAAIMKRQSDELAEKMPKTLPQVRPGTAMSAQALAEAAKLLNEKQRSVADARCAVVAAVLGIKYQYDCSAKAAVAQFLGLLAEGKLDAVTLGNLEKANDRSRSAKVGERTLDGWISAYLKAENATERLVALAPKTTKAVKPIESYGWLPMFMQFHNIPSAPKLAHSYRRFVQWAEAENMPVNDVPNLSMVRRVWDKLPLIMQERGRKTGAAYKSLLPYVKRDWGALKPNDVWIGDGHSFKAKVAHPVHGRPFKPEVTVIIDGCTRFVVGFSVSLAESCVAVSDALRIGVKHFGLPIIYYSDNGGGQTGKTIDHEITGITSRLGIRHETGIAGNPQGRGIIERWWKDNLIEMARQYETFAGAGMDSSTKNLMYRKMESAFNALEKRQGFDGGTTEIFEKTAGLVAFYRGCGQVYRRIQQPPARRAAPTSGRRALFAEGLSGNEAGTGRYRAGYVVGARAGDDVYAARGAKGTARLAGFVQQLLFFGGAGGVSQRRGTGQLRFERCVGGQCV